MCKRTLLAHICFSVLLLCAMMVSMGEDPDIWPGRQLCHSGWNRNLHNFSKLLLNPNAHLVSALKRSSDGHLLCKFLAIHCIVLVATYSWYSQRLLQGSQIHWWKEGNLTWRHYFITLIDNTSFMKNVRHIIGYLVLKIGYPNIKVLKQGWNIKVQK